MTRVLLVHQPVDGGVARHVADLAEGLTARGFDAVLCGPGLPVPSGSESAVPPEVPHVALAMQRSVSPRADLSGLVRFSRIVRAVQPDLIHAHSSKAGALARLGKLVHPRVPVLYSPHGYAFAGFFEHELERRMYREAERALAQLTRYVIAVCQAEARLAAQAGAARRVKVVYNGVDTPPDGPVDQRIAELSRRGPVVCAVAHFRPGKGVETLIDASAEVAAHCPDVSFAIVGDGPLREALLARVRDRGVEHIVHFLGEHREPESVLRGADVFAFTSWAEAFPYVILEAMAVGLPTVSSAVGGVPEAIDDGRTGLLVPARDPASTARALIDLLDAVELRSKLGAAARETVRLRFTRARMVDDVAAIYAELVDTRGIGTAR